MSLWLLLKQLVETSPSRRLGWVTQFLIANLMTEAVTVNSPSHEDEEDFDDVGCNADLYASRQDAFQGSSRGSDERSQQQSDPHCFQSLSLD